MDMNLSKLQKIMKDEEPGMLQSMGSQSAMRLPKSVTQCFKFSNLTASHQIQTLIQVTAN